MNLSDPQVAARAVSSHGKAEGPDPSDGPTPAEPLGPDSLAWRLGFPRTGLLLAGRALLLQVMHPVVGAGVRDFSDFKRDPWGRLDRTVTSLQVQLFGGSKATEEAARLRKMHGQIKGIGFAGEHYSALNQDAYAWVHLSNFDTLLTFDKLIARQLDGTRREQLYAEWRQAGRVLGIRDEHMPPDLTALGEYVQHTITTALVDNPTAREVLASFSIREVGAPPWPLFPAPLWKALRPLGRTVFRDLTVGTLPPSARDTLSLPWTAADQRRFRALVTALRTASAPIPDLILQYPMARKAQVQARRYRATPVLQPAP